MRVIEAFDEPVRAVAVSPDGRSFAAAAGFGVAVLDWLSGEVIVRVGCSVPVGQLAFTTDGIWLVFAFNGGVFRLACGGGKAVPLSEAAFSGGVAAAPDGKTLVATLAAPREQAQLERWELPSWRGVSGFDYWSPFHRLAFS